MKITTALSYASALALATFVAGVFVYEQALASGLFFVALLVTLTAVRDYRRRSYFVVTARPVAASRAPVPLFGSALGLQRRHREVKRRVALAA